MRTLMGLETRGATAFYDGLVQAMRLLDDADRFMPKWVVALTDGADTVSYEDAVDKVRCAPGAAFRSPSLLTSQMALLPYFPLLAAHPPCQVCSALEKTPAMHLALITVSGSIKPAPPGTVASVSPKTDQVGMQS